MNDRSRKGSERRYEKPGAAGRRVRGRAETVGRGDLTERQNVIYGVNPVRELLRSNSARIERILISIGVRVHRLDEIQDLARERHLKVDRVDSEILDRATGGKRSHQGVAAVVAAHDYFDADALIEELGHESLVLVLDGVEDPRNLGAVLRTAECAGVSSVFIPERRAVGLTDSAAKSSAGAVEHVRVARVPNLSRLIESVKKKNIWVVGAASGAETDYTEWDWSQPTALVLGSEGNGLHRLVAASCDVLVKIPNYGKIESLNVSVAAGVILFEARRQRKAKFRTIGE